MSKAALEALHYDGNGNLTGDGRRVFEYDCENQLTNVYVASAWRSAFQYDAFGRRRVRREYGWSSAIGEAIGGQTQVANHPRWAGGEQLGTTCTRVRLSRQRLECVRLTAAVFRPG